MIEALLHLPGLLVRGVAAWVRTRIERRRGRRLQAFSAANGWTYAPDASHLLVGRRGMPFERRLTRRASHLVTGTTGDREFAAFQIDHGELPGDVKRDLVTVTMVSLPTALPDLEITSQGLGARVATMLGAQDIRFESEEFNRRWRVEAAEPRVAHAIVHPRFMELLTAGPPDPVRFEGTDLWTWHPGPFEPAALHARLARLEQLAALVPRHVWQDHGHDPHPVAGGALGSAQGER